MFNSPLTPIRKAITGLEKNFYTGSIKKGITGLEKKMNTFNSPSNPIMKGLVKAADWELKDPVSFTRWTGAFNFSLLCGTQALFVSHNKKIPKESKKFLVTSEIIEGVMKAGIFLGLAKGFGGIGESLVKKGYLVPKGLVKGATGLPKKLTRDSVVNLIKKVEGNPDKYKEQFKSLTKFTDGVKMSSNIIGMIVGLSICVPIARNFMAKTLKEKFMNTSDNKNTNQDSFKYTNPVKNPDVIYYTGKNKVYEKFLRNVAR